MDNNRIVVFLLAVLAVIAVGLVLSAAKAVVLPLVIAWLLSHILGPTVNAFTKRHAPTPLAVAFVMALLVGVCYVGTTFLYARVSAFVEAYPRYEGRLVVLIDAAKENLRLPPNALQDFNWQQKVYAFLVSMSGSLLSFLSKLLVVVIFLVFILLGKPYFACKMRTAFKPASAQQLTEILNAISGQIGKYLSIQLVVSLATGILVWGTLRGIGVDFAVTWGALAFFLNFIPTIGSIVASIPPVLLALVQFYPRFWPGVLTLVSLLAIQVTIGNFVTPKLMGDRLNLSPVAVLLSLVFWYWLWGPVGALLSVPIAAAIRIVCSNVETLRPIGVLMGSGKRYAREEAARDRPAG